MTIVKKYYDGKDEDIQMKIHEETKKLCKEKDIPYPDALAEVLKNNPEDAELYIDSNSEEKKVDFSKVIDAEKEIDIQTTILTLQSGIEYTNALKIVMALPKNSELVKRYTGGQ